MKAHAWEHKPAPASKTNEQQQTKGDARIDKKLDYFGRGRWFAVYTSGSMSARSVCFWACGQLLLCGVAKGLSVNVT